MEICPICASECIFFSKKHNQFFCEDCENGFTEPAIERGMRLFISYGHDRNAEIVKAIKEYLSKKGFDVWIDSSEIMPGSDWREKITNGIMGSSGVIAFLSKHSVRVPGVCVDELRIAMRLKHAMVKSVLLEDYDEVKPPARIAENQWVDLGDWSTIKREEWDAYFDEKLAELIVSLENGCTDEYAEELKKISSRLNVYESITKEQKLLKETFVGREWLMEKLENSIQNSDKRFFTIFGVPGAGKSAFAAKVVQNSPDVLADIFFEWDNHNYSNLDYVIKLLALKIAEYQADYRAMLIKQLDTTAYLDKVLESLHKEALLDFLVLNPLCCCIDGNRARGMIILDGLDETTDEVAELLIRKAKDFPDWIKFVFLLRYDEANQARFADFDQVILDDTQDNNNRDIALYFKSRLGLEEADSQCLELVAKCEGSFIVAKILADAILDKKYDLQEAESLPSGINDFFFALFSRNFPDEDEYRKIRPLFEIMAADEEIPISFLLECLNMDKYDFWDLRAKVKSLAVTTKLGQNGNIKGLKFVHKSIKDWITNKDQSGRFCVLLENGYKRFVECAENKYAIGEQIGSFEAMQPGNNKTSYNSEWYDGNKLCKTYYPKWLAKCGAFEKYEHLLLTSFDEVELDGRYKSNCNNYLLYNEIFDLWRWADLFPTDYDMDGIIAKLDRLVIYPKKHMCSRFAHRSFQISFHILAQIMNSGRFAEVYYHLMRAVSFGGYFCSSASDDVGETRDGWDKYYMTRDAAICMKKLIQSGKEIPLDVREKCECMKFYYHFCNGRPEGMFEDESAFGSIWVYGIHSERELFKDICILDHPKDIKQKARYNTLSLQYYLSCSEEEDEAFILRSVAHQANLYDACNNAIKDIDKNINRTLSAERASKRLKYIKKLLEYFEND